MINNVKPSCALTNAQAVSQMATLSHRDHMKFTRQTRSSKIIFDSSSTC